MRDEAGDTWDYVVDPVRRLATRAADWFGNGLTSKTGQSPNPPWWILNPAGAAGAVLLALCLAGAEGRGLLSFHLVDRGASTFTVGFMLMGLVLFTRKESQDTGSAASREDSTQHLWGLATASAAVWLVAAAGHLWSQYQAQPPKSAVRPLAMYATLDWHGRFLALQLVLVVVVAVIAHWGAQGVLSGSTVLALAIAALLPAALAPTQDYGPPDRWLKLLHVLSAVAWCGGLAGLLLLARRLVPTKVLVEVARVYSDIALAAAVSITVTGVGLGLGWLKGDAWDTFIHTGDGRLILGKLLALALLLTVGAVHRGLTLKRLAELGDPKILIWLGLVELAIMGITFAMSIGVSDAAFSSPTRP